MSWFPASSGEAPPATSWASLVPFLTPVPVGSPSADRLDPASVTRPSVDIASWGLGGQPKAAAPSPRLPSGMLWEAGKACWQPTRQRRFPTDPKTLGLLLGSCSCLGCALGWQWSVSHRPPSCRPVSHLSVAAQPVHFTLRKARCLEGPAGQERSESLWTLSSALTFGSSLERSRRSGQLQCHVT